MGDDQTLSMPAISSFARCKSFRLQHLAIALLLIVALRRHTSLQANLQSQLWRQEANASIPVAPLESHDVVSDAPFYFSACLLMKDDNKVRFCGAECVV
jgi:hypothetical protein